MSKKMMRSPNSVDPELADAQAKLVTAEDAKSKLERLVDEKVAEVTQLKIKLADAEKRATTAEDTARGIMPLRRENEELRTKNANLEATVTDKEGQLSHMEKQLEKAMDGTQRMQTELSKAQDQSEQCQREQKKATAQWELALRDLASAEEEIKKERAAKTKAEEGKSRAEKALEDLMAQFQENSRDVDAAVRWNTASQLWLTMGLTACGTASLVSVFFLKYYSKI